MATLLKFQTAAVRRQLAVLRLHSHYDILGCVNGVRPLGELLALYREWLVADGCPETEAYVEALRLEFERLDPWHRKL